MAETTGLPFEKKAIIPIDPRTKIFLTVTSVPLWWQEEQAEL